MGGAGQRPLGADRVEPAAADDPDCDGFATGSELRLGTNPTAHCAATPAADDEPPPDAWPFDFNNDQRASLQDVLRFAPVFGSRAGDQRYRARFDLVGDGRIDLKDILSFANAFNKSCA